ncbi:MAG: DNA double-strand break repair nuclease NurA [Candidatus Korarchaeota archaeon]
MSAIRERRRKVFIGADYWNKLLRELPNVVEETADDISNLHERILNYSGDILIFGNEWKKYRIDTRETRELREKFPFAGVDSSMTPPQRLGPYLVSAVSAALVITRGVCDEPLKSLNVKIEKAPELSDAKHAINEIRLKMFELETEMINKAIGSLKNDYGKGVILIDGPIVDPPNFPKSPQPLRNYYETEYAKSRSNIIHYGISEGLNIIGVVKKISGNFLSEYLANTLNEKDLFEKVNDYTIATLLFKSKKLNNILISACNSYEDVILATRPLELSEKGTDYRAYREHGIYVFYFYILMSLRDLKKKILRLEIVFDHEPQMSELLENAWKAAKLVAAATLPGHSLPAPIILAHESCTIPRSTAKIIMREMVSRYLTNFSKQRLGSLEVAINLSLNLLE